MQAEPTSTATLPVASMVVRRAQKGDVAAFEQLYHENLGRVFALCLRLSGDRGRAEELTQDVFVRAWEKLGSFEGKSAFSTWLHRLAVNVVLGDRRSEKSRTA
ncbi:MAG TPA: sigma-70 family RNA polymerase sigma factor [Longimicrobium sp.]